MSAINDKRSRRESQNVKLAEWSRISDSETKVAMPTANERMMLTIQGMNYISSSKRRLFCIAIGTCTNVFYHH